MSLEESVKADSNKIDKEERRRRKQEKRSAREAKASASTAASDSKTTDVLRKEKKDKKRKRDGLGDLAANKALKQQKGDEDGKGQVAVGKVDRVEREKTAEVSSDTPRPASNGTEFDPIPSKKQLKKLARATAASSSTVLATPTPTPRAFTDAEQSYLSTHAITLTPSHFPPHLSISSLPVHPKFLAFLGQFKEPTPIQACSWPPLLAGRDVIGIAETGSGKTLAFGVPGLDRILGKELVGDAGDERLLMGKKGKGRGWISMLVLAPTRELAQQSHETLVALGAGVGVKSVCLFGGVGKEDQLGLLRKKEVKIVVGTPGRTLDLADAGSLDLSDVQYLVLDEADRMLDQGFENDIRRIIAHCPVKENRQTVMFSATWPESVRRLASTFLCDPVRITVGSDELSANKRIEQVVEVLDHPGQKDARMLHHLRTHLKAHPSTVASPTRILVFALYKKEAQRLESTIRRANYNVGALHGDLGQDARFKALDKFKTGTVNVLVATDVAARGLDIPDVGLVLNVTFPLTTEDFVHRCGRTGRAGKSGKAVTFFTGENHERSLAGEFMRVLRDAGTEIPKEMDRFPSTIKKKEHGSYGAFYRDLKDAPAPTKITFD